MSPSTSPSSVAARPVRRPPSPWPEPGVDVVARRQGPLPPRQVLRRRPDRRRPAPARASRPRPERGGVVAADRRRLSFARPRVASVDLPAPPRHGAVRRGRPARRARRRAARRGPGRRRQGARRARRRRRDRRTAIGSPSNWMSRASARSPARYVIGADGMWSPLRKAVGRGRPTRRHGSRARRVARLPPVLQRRRARAASRAVRLVRARPAARLRLVVPAPRRRANVGFGILATAARSTGPGHEASCGPTCSPGPHRRRARARRGPPEAPHKAWPIPPRRPRRRTRATGGSSSSATRRAPRIR